MGAKPSIVAEQMVDIAALSARATIIEAWEKLEWTAVTAIMTNQPAAGGEISLTPPNHVREILEYLRIYQIVQNEEMLLLISKLNELRNLAVHADQFEIDEATARSYLHAAESVRVFLVQRGAIDG